jgi:hypothetical protein
MEQLPKFSKKEYNNYERQQDKAYFKTPEQEFEWAKTQTKKCSKCHIDKELIYFNGNTSGTDAFDKAGYRLRRPECSDCTKKVLDGKTQAKQLAKEEGIQFKAPEGTVCAICNKLPTKGNSLVFDHCHTKNTFRGYCCNSCNRSMGVLGDSVDGILKVLNYLLVSDPCKIIQNDNGSLSKI